VRGPGEPWLDRERVLVLDDVKLDRAGRIAKTGGWLERHNARNALTVWGAFANFCNEELLVEPEKLLKAWFELILPEIEKLKDIPDPPEADPEGLKEYETALRQAWSGLVREA
jgi:hypothetical protein